MQALRKLPFFDRPTVIKIADTTIPIRPYQIIVWISLGSNDSLEADAARFPAVLDTGHNHNLSIRQEQFESWAGRQVETSRRSGSILVNRQDVPLYAANLWIHRNRPGTSELLPRPVRLAVPQGIAVYPRGLATAPRLPLLGVRALVTSGLRLTISSGSMSVSLAHERPARP